MRISYNSLNKEGKRIANRYGKYFYYLLIFQALVLFVLVIYTNIAVQPNLLVIEIGMLASSGSTAMGFFMIEKQRNRILSEYQETNDEGDRATP